MSRLLIFDTSGGACSAAVWADGRVAAERFEAMARGQAERLLPMIEETLAAAGLAHGQLDAIGVTRGPGAFTGIRIGLAAARGLALALDIPTIGITTFEALAVRAPEGCAVAIDTKRGDVFFQLFGPGGVAEGEPGILTPAAATAAAEEKGVPLVADTPRAAEFAPLVAARHEEFSAGGCAPPGMPRPLYLRPPEARLPGSGRRIQQR